MVVIIELLLLLLTSLGGRQVGDIYPNGISGGVIVLRCDCVIELPNYGITRIEPLGNSKTWKRVTFVDLNRIIEPSLERQVLITLRGKIAHVFILRLEDENGNRIRLWGKRRG